MSTKQSFEVCVDRLDTAVANDFEDGLAAQTPAGSSNDLGDADRYEPVLEVSGEFAHAIDIRAALDGNTPFAPASDGRAADMEKGCEFQLAEPDVLRI